MGRACKKALSAPVLCQALHKVAVECHQQSTGGHISSHFPTQTWKSKNASPAHPERERAVYLMVGGGSGH